jgi:hypothetical protein
MVVAVNNRILHSIVKILMVLVISMVIHFLGMADYVLAHHNSLHISLLMTQDILQSLLMVTAK